MTASSGVVLGNLAYLIGAVVVAVIGGLIVWLHHRQPKSVDANVESFNRGLRALAPDPSSPGSRRTPAGPGPSVPRIQPRTVLPTRYENPEPPVDAADEQLAAAAGETGGPAAPTVAPMAEEVIEEEVIDLSSPEMRDPAAVKRAGAETG
jgi:hypothetical protein